MQRPEDVTVQEPRREQGHHALGRQGGGQQQVWADGEEGSRQRGVAQGSERYCVPGAAQAGSHRGLWGGPGCRQKAPHACE